VTTYRRYFPNITIIFMSEFGHV